MQGTDLSYVTCFYQCWAKLSFPHRVKVFKIQKNEMNSMSNNMW